MAVGSRVSLWKMIRRETMNTGKFVTLVVLSTFIMGSSIAVVKIGLAYVSPLLFASFCFQFAGLILSVIVLFLKRKHPRTLKDWLKILAIGAFQSTEVSIGIFVGLWTISAIEISILTYTSPLFNRGIYLVNRKYEKVKI